MKYRLTDVGEGLFPQYSGIYKSNLNIDVETALELGILEEVPEKPAEPSTKIILTDLGIELLPAYSKTPIWDDVFEANTGMDIAKAIELGIIKRVPEKPERIEIDRDSAGAVIKHNGDAFTLDELITMSRALNNEKPKKIFVQLDTAGFPISGEIIEKDKL